MTDDIELLARLKAQADDAWIEAMRLAHLADADPKLDTAWKRALEGAREATYRYQTCIPPVPFIG